MSVATWGNQPYMEVEKSGRQTAKVCSFIRTFLHGEYLQHLGSLTASRTNCTPWQFYGRFSELMDNLSTNCTPWQFDGHFSDIHSSVNKFWSTTCHTSAVWRPVFRVVAKTCHTSAVWRPVFRHEIHPVSKLHTLAVWRPVFRPKIHLVSKLHTLAVWRPVFGYYYSMS